MKADTQKELELTRITPPPLEQRVRRNARFPEPGEKPSRYTLPAFLESCSPVGYRTRVSMSAQETEGALKLLSLERPTSFIASADITEQELFEECSLGILTSRQSTNYRGQKEVVLGPSDSETLASLLNELVDAEAEVLPQAAYSHVVFYRPYRTPFTMLLTLVGHMPVASLLTVPMRAWAKRFRGQHDIPTIGYLSDLHLGILADSMERACVISSLGKRKAQILLRPFCGYARKHNKKAVRAIEELCELTGTERRAGWQLAFVAQCGEVTKGEKVDLPVTTFRKLGANLMAFRSERIQPGVNQDKRAPEAYQHRQDMDVPDQLTVMAGRAAYNAFTHWTGCEREASKNLLLLDRIDVLTDGGKERLRAIRDHLSDVTDRVAATLPLWADLPTGKLFSRNVKRGRKAFALAGQRIYIGGVSFPEISSQGLEAQHAIRGTGAAATRGALYAELMGCTEIPEDCDLLAGICLMAGPVNQNDIGKTYFAEKDLLDSSYGERNPTSLLMWTLKAKTVADPIGNEEQLLNPARKGALVDLRTGPHEVIRLKTRSGSKPMRYKDGKKNEERAFAELDNFVTDPDGRAIPGNVGAPWPKTWREASPFAESD